MNVLNNTATMVSLGELNKNISQVGKQLKKVASGQKINGAGDGASEYAVSERMRVRIRGLEQDIENTKTGSSMLRVAEGGVQNIIEELKSLRELAVNAANDHNTDADRAVLQKEFNQRKADIEDIATSTNYNGKLLLDGTYAHYKMEQQLVTPGSGGSDGTDGSGGSGGTGPVGPVPAPYTPVSTGVLEPNDAPSALPSNGYISSAGVYTIPPGFTGTITIADDVSGSVKGVKLVQANPSVPLTNTYIVGPSGGNANLWLENVNIQNTGEQSTIQFQGSGNVLNIKGDNTVKGGGSKAVIHVGNGLTVEGSGSLTSASGSGAGIGTNSGESDNTAPLTINSGTYNITSQIHSAGSAIGSGQYAKIGDIVINGGNFTLGDPFTWGAPIGAGTGADNAGGIYINNATIDIKAYDGGIGTGLKGFLHKTGEGALEDDKVSPLKADGKIVIENSYIATISTKGAGIGSGEDGAVGDITVTNSILNVKKPPEEYPYPADSDLCQHDATQIGHGAGWATAGTVDISGSKINIVDPDDPDPPDPPVPPEYKYVQVVGNPLVIHTGTKANQALYCYIDDMRLDALGLGQDKETGVDKVKVSTRRDAEIALGAMVKENWNLLDPLYDDASEEERNNPDNYMGPIDRALGYVLDQSTQLGAYLMELEYTATNLTTAHENTTASESTIRDADMAKEMTAYTKANVIAQASQSMLAQANQTASSVLSLLQ